MTTLPETKMITILDSCSWQDYGIKIAEMYGELMAFLGKNKNLQMAGAPFAIYSKWDEATQFTVFEAGLPVDQEVKGGGRVNFKVLPESRAINGTHFGRYEDIGPLYMAMEEYVKEFSLEEKCCPMEVYITDPMAEPDTSKWQTDVYFPVK